MRTGRGLLISGLLVLLLSLTTGCSLTADPDGDSTAITGAPTVRIAAPLPGAVILTGVGVNIQVLIGNAGADIARVDFIVDDAAIASLEAPNTAGTLAFSLTQPWTTDTIGEHTIRVIAIRADGTGSDPAAVTVRVVGDPTPAPESTPEATAAAEPAAQTSPAAPVSPTTPPTISEPTAAPTSAPTAAVETAPTTAPTATPTTAPASTGGAPVATFTQGINVRRGPSTLFNPPIGSFAAGQTAEIIGLNPAGDWLKIRYGGGEGWVFASLTTIAGDTSTLPRDPGPPLPTATPLAPTLPPAAVVTPAPTAGATSDADLVTGVYIVNPNPLVCNQTTQIELDVANLGTTATAASGTVSVVDRHNASGTQTTTVGAFPILQPGQTFRVAMQLTVSVYFEEDHTLTLTINADGALPERTRDNNTITIAYRLQRGGC